MLVQVEKSASFINFLLFGVSKVTLYQQKIGGKDRTTLLWQEHYITYIKFKADGPNYDINATYSQQECFMHPGMS